MIPRLKPRFGLAEILTAAHVGHDGDIKRFENEFAHLAEQNRAVTFPYGRTALVALLDTMGLKGKDVILPAYTCVVVAHAVIISGNKPVFVDSQEHDFNMDIEAASAKVNENTGAIIMTSLFGYPVDLDALDAFRERFPHVKIIQDCAHSFLADWRGRGVQKEGVAAIYGLNISKLMSSIFGGMVTTDDEELYDALLKWRVRHLQPSSWSKSLSRMLYLLATYPAFYGPLYGFVNYLERNGFLDRFVRYYDESLIEMPADYLVCMTPLEARVGIVQTRRYGDIIRHRRDIAAYYNATLAPYAGKLGILLPPNVEGATYSHFAVQTARKAELMEKALNHGVQLGEVIEYCVPAMSSYAGSLQPDESFPVAERFSHTVINLPLSCSFAESRHVASVLLSELN
ncbi:MAG: DegT/DnrJ/EryC1/StrS family aminotransferase [Rhodospirillales bacterium]